MSRTYIAGERERTRSYSKAVKVSGGEVIYLAGVGGAFSQDGTTPDFAGQTRNAFQRLRENLELAGGTLADLTTMTVFITDVRYGDEFTAIRHEILGPENYPASALITVAGLARPEMLVEIQAVAVIGA